MATKRKSPSQTFTAADIQSSNHEKFNDSNISILPNKVSKLSSNASPNQGHKKPKEKRPAKLSNKERKRLEKILEKKKTRHERPDLYAELTKYQVNTNVLNEMSSVAMLHVKGPSVTSQIARFYTRPRFC